MKPLAQTALSMFVPLVLALAALFAATGLLIRQVLALRGRRAKEEAEAFARDILDNAGEGIVVYDRELRYVAWNRFMEEMTGIRATDVLGRHTLANVPHPRDQNLDDMLQSALEGEVVFSPDIRYETPQSGRWISVTYRPRKDAAGAITGVIAVVRDVTERKAVEQQIEYQAYHDALTGLANRRLFQEHLALALALAQRHGRRVGVLFLDIDHFKVVNDSLGHSVGDALLRQVSQRLRASVREGDTVARVGGDEFTIVLQEMAHPNDAALVAEKVLAAVAGPIQIDGHHLYVTTSVGISVSPEDGDDAEALLRNADAAMYRAKAAGRNTYQLATPEFSEATRERMELESGLHRAIEAGELVVLYQPQYEIETNAIVGAEALLRWNHPELGMVLPEVFIGVAEDGGLILPIGDWVVRKACRDARRIQLTGMPHFRIAVNISARQFRNPRLLADVVSAVHESGIDPGTLELEITESVAMENVELTMSTLSDLRRAGVMIAIDDFGTGHSSLAYLKRFQIDAVKIDRSFVTDLPNGYEDAAIVSSVIQLANGLGLRAIAEGVETGEQLAFLAESGCREVQGFLFSHPVPIEEVERLVAGESRLAHPPAQA